MSYGELYTKMWLETVIDENKNDKVQPKLHTSEISTKKSLQPKATKKHAA
jgi:hypothetical protein